MASKSKEAKNVVEILEDGKSILRIEAPSGLKESVQAGAGRAGTTKGIGLYTEGVRFPDLKSVTKAKRLTKDTYDVISKSLTSGKYSTVAGRSVSGKGKATEFLGFVEKSKVASRYFLSVAEMFAP